MQNKAGKHFSLLHTSAQVFRCCLDLGLPVWWTWTTRQIYQSLNFDSRPRMIFLSSMQVWKQFGCGTEAIVSMLGWRNPAAEWWDLLTCCQHQRFFDILWAPFFKNISFSVFFHQAGRMLRKLYKGVALSNSNAINKRWQFGVCNTWGRAKRGCVQSDISTAPFSIQA